MNQLLKSEPMTIFGDGTQQRAFTHIDDVAPLIAVSPNLADARNQIFNIGADVPYTVNELASCVASVLNKECRTQHLAPRNEVKLAFSDHAKAERVFGVRNKVPLLDGLQAMAQWVNAHGARESSVFENIEVARNMPPSWAAITRAIDNISRTPFSPVRDSNAQLA